MPNPGTSSYLESRGYLGKSRLCFLLGLGVIHILGDLDLQGRSEHTHSLERDMQLEETHPSTWVGSGTVSAPDPLPSFFLLKSLCVSFGRWSHTSRIPFKLLSVNRRLLKSSSKPDY